MKKYLLLVLIIIFGLVAWNKGFQEGCARATFFKSPQWNQDHMTCYKVWQFPHNTH